MKKLLLIMPLKSNYHVDIINTLNSEGYHVDFFPDFDESFVKRAIRYVSKPLINWIQNDYLLKRIATINETNYDIVFVIRGYSFSKSSIEKIKKKFCKARFFLYQWDPLSISKFDESAVSLFDNCFSFDRADCSRNNAITYLPLFYKQTAIKENNKCDNSFDFSFIGSIHSNRFSVLTSLIKLMEKEGYTYYIRGYINKISYYWGWLQNKPGYRNFQKELISFTPIPREIVQNVFARSKIVIDINHPSQTGLSIRVAEVLSKGKKLLTTNKTILAEPFFNPNVIGIIEGENFPDNIENLLNCEDSIDLSQLEIINWLRTILN